MAQKDPIARARRCLADPFHDIDIIDIPLSRGAGARVWDTADNCYIDYTMSKGVSILGHAESRVNKKVAEFLQTEANILFSGPFHDRHVRLAERLCHTIPCAEKVRFFKTGSCAATAAVRLTRMVNGGDLVLSSGYHGWHDWALQGVEMSSEPLGGVINFSYDLDRLRALLHEHSGRIACIFVTPEPSFFAPQLLVEMRNISLEHSVPLIFDEVKTGFRFSIGGYQRYIDVIPDLAIFSKGLANGFSLSALVGKDDFMAAASATNLASTYQVEISPFVAAEETLRIIDADNVIEALWTQGARLIAGLERIFVHHDLAASILTCPPMFHIVFEHVDEARAFHRLSFKRGVLTYPFDNQILCHAHDESTIDESLNVFEDTVKTLPRTIPRESLKPRAGSLSITRDALDLYTSFEFGGRITNYPAPAL